MIGNTPIILAIVLIVVIGFFMQRRKVSPAPIESAPADIMSPEAWQIGPIIHGVNMSRGVPLHPTPHADGWSIDIPYPAAENGSVHYVTVPCGSLAGKTKVTLKCRAETADGTRFYPTKFPGAPASMTLYFQRAGDDWSAQGPYETYRWYASFSTVGLGAGEFVLEARFDQNWTAIMSSSRASHPDAFQAAINDAGRIGFVLGGGDGLGHGVFATGPARLVVTSFVVE